MLILQIQGMLNIIVKMLKLSKIIEDEKNSMKRESINI